jgi:hypothetical protein
LVHYVSTLKIPMKNTLAMLVMLCAAVPLATAQGAAPAAPADGAGTADASSAVLAPKRAQDTPTPAPQSDGTAKSVSPSVAAALADVMPKYIAPTPQPAAPAASQEAADGDKPKNEIPRLPQYVVRERRPPVFRNQDLYSPSGLVDLSFKGHPGLKIGNLFGLNEGPARDMAYDDQRLQNIEDLNETAYSMARGGDNDEAQFILKANQDANMRDAGDFGPVGSLLGGGGK